MMRLMSRSTYRPLIAVASYIAFPPEGHDKEEILGLEHMFSLSAKEQADKLKLL